MDVGPPLFTLLQPYIDVDGWVPKVVGVVSPSLRIVTFLSHMSRVLPLMQTTREVNPHPHIMAHVY
jgi:hypothetical protein